MTRPTTALDAGLLVLRIGAGLTLALLFAWGGFPNATVVGITGHASAVLAVALLGALTTFGFATRPAAALLAGVMAWPVIAGWRTGQDLFEEPARALMLAVLYTALALIGPGVFSLDSVVGPIVPTGRQPGDVGVRSTPVDVTSSTHAGPTRAPAPRRADGRIDAGLLVLRVGTGLSLFLLFGLTKVGWIAALVHSRGPWSEWAFAKLIASVGMPAPLILAACAVLNETVTPLLVTTGLCTRAAATIGAFGMAGAMYTSLRIGEEPLRAAVYVVAFATLALTGPGKYSVDQLLRLRRRARAGVQPQKTRRVTDSRCQPGRA